MEIESYVRSSHISFQADFCILIIFIQILAHLCNDFSLLIYLVKDMFEIPYTHDFRDCILN